MPTLEVNRSAFRSALPNADLAFEGCDSEANDNDFVLDSDIKNQQRITLMSLLYSRALERKLNAIRARKPSYSLNKKEHVRKHK